MSKKEIDEYELAKSFLAGDKWKEKWDEVYGELLKEPCIGIEMGNGEPYTFNKHAKDFISGLLFSQCLSLAQKVIKMQKSQERIEAIRDEIGKLLDEIIPNQTT